MLDTACSFANADTACFFAIPHQVREEGGLVTVLDTGPQKDRRYRQSQESRQALLQA